MDNCKLKDALNQPFSDLTVSKLSFPIPSKIGVTEVFNFQDSKLNTKSGEEPSFQIKDISENAKVSLASKMQLGGLVVISKEIHVNYYTLNMFDGLHREVFIGFRPDGMLFCREIDASTCKSNIFPISLKPVNDMAGGKQKEFSGGGKKKEVKKEIGLGLSYTKDENFREWYSEVVVNGEMIKYYDISGCYVLRPWVISI